MTAQFFKGEVRGLRGESQADILRRTGQYGVLPTDTDAQAMAKFAAAAESAAFIQAERANDEADRAQDEANRSEVARQGSEQAKDTARGWAEGPVPTGGTRSAKGWAEVAQANAAVSDNARAAVQQAISLVPSDTTLMLEAVSIAVLKGVSADTPVGRLAYLAESGREGVWQLRSGDFTSLLTADAFGFRYLKITSVPATQKAWVRIIPDGVFQATWTGINVDTADAVPMLKSAVALIDPYSVLELAGFRHRIGTADPRIALKIPGTHVRGRGWGTHCDFVGPSSAFAMFQLAADDTAVTDMRISMIAPRGSAGNPTGIMISPNGQYAQLTQTKRHRVQNVKLDRTSLGLIVFAHYIDGQPENGFLLPQDIDISEVEVETNGTGISLFGGRDIRVNDYSMLYADPDATNAGAVKQMGFRILGSENVHVGAGDLYDFPIGAGLDAANFGVRAYNKDLGLRSLRMTGVKMPIDVFECRGDLVVSGLRSRRPLSTTDTSYALRINTNVEPSTSPGQPTEVGNILFEEFDCEGVSCAVIESGRMGNLTVQRGRVAGNKSISNSDGVRGSIIISNVAGSPKSITADGVDFLLTAPDAGTSMSLTVDTPGGLISVRDCLLPETPSAFPPLSVTGQPVVYTDAVEQRPFNNRVNLGSNRIHRVGDLARYRDGTAVPVALPTSTAWIRNFVNTSETATNVFSKTGGAAGASDAAVYSTQKLVGDFELVYRVNQPSDLLGVGLVEAYTNPGWGGLNWGTLYSGNGGASSPVRNGGQIQAVGAYGTDTVERWRRRGSRLIFSRGNVDLFDTTVSPDTPFALQIAFSRQNDEVTVLRFGPI
ncbi:hypothetical protein [uncultured Novosphingobium sp.]|uniref:hypothetical protein n=1 Tax=uncultured Novosphingobium sp. TaxID=292277 RepID=UPI003747EBEF